jgi:hypothetical protein
MQQAINDTLDIVQALVGYGVPLDVASKAAYDLIAIGKRSAPYTPECQLEVDRVRARQHLAAKFEVVG